MCIINKKKGKACRTHKASCKKKKICGGGLELPPPKKMHSAINTKINREYLHRHDVAIEAAVHALMHQHADLFPRVDDLDFTLRFFKTMLANQLNMKIASETCLRLQMHLLSVAHTLERDPCIELSLDPGLQALQDEFTGLSGTLSQGEWDAICRAFAGGDTLQNKTPRQALEACLCALSAGTQLRTLEDALGRRRSESLKQKRFFGTHSTASSWPACWTAANAPPANAHKNCSAGHRGCSTGPRCRRRGRRRTGSCSAASRRCCWSSSCS